MQRFRLPSILASAALWLSPAQAQTDCIGCATVIPAGPVSGVWVPSGSPYCVQGDIQISSLTILPGVCVRTAPGALITINGVITAVGTEDAPIVFTELDADLRWTGIEMSNTQPGSAFVHCVIEKADRSGLRIVDSTPVLEHCTFRDNHSVSDHGGAILLQNGAGNPILVDRCRFEGNVANPNAASGNRVGGAIYAFGAGALTVRESHFEGNTARGFCSGTSCDSFARGGAIYSADKLVTIETSSFVGQQLIAQCSGAFCGEFARGGALYLASGEAVVQGSVFVGAIYDAGSQQAGGGIYVAAGTASVENCTVVRNAGEGLRRAGGTLSVRNSIVFSNEGGEVPGATSVDYSCIEGGIAGTDNISFNPVFRGTEASLCDVTISTSSPCIDAGDPAAVWDDVCFPPSYGTSRNDMGYHGGPLACAWGEDLGTTFCSPANPTSTGLPAFMKVWGTASADEDCLTLDVTGIPASQFGFFLVGDAMINVQPMGSEGILCVGGMLGRFNAQIILGPTDRIQVPLTGLPTNPPADITSGSTWLFQCWFRDGGTNNFSDAVSVTFD